MAVTKAELKMQARVALASGKSLDEAVSETKLPPATVKLVESWLKSKAGRIWAGENNLPGLKGHEAIKPEAPPRAETSLQRVETPRTEAPRTAGPLRTQLLVDTSGQGLRAQGVSAGSPGDGSNDGLVPVPYDDGSGNRRIMMMPVNALNRGRGTVNITALTLSYYDRANYDYLAEMKRRTADPAQVPPEYPDGLPGFLEDCVVGYFEHVLRKKLVWAEVGQG